MEGAPERNALWNRVILESKHFVVVPSLGHFVSGWLLLMPKVHYPCIGALKSDLLSEFLAVKERAASMLRSLYGATIQFEHGTCLRKGGGTCVEHAHWHLVPISVNLLSHLKKTFGGYKADSISDLAKMYTQRKAYLAYQESDSQLFVFQPSLIPSQYMRQLIAVTLAIPNKYDWRKYAGTLELEAFLRKLAKLPREVTRNGYLAKRR